MGKIHKKRYTKRKLKRGGMLAAARAAARVIGRCFGPACGSGSMPPYPQSFTVPPLDRPVAPLAGLAPLARPARGAPLDRPVAPLASSSSAAPGASYPASFPGIPRGPSGSRPVSSFSVVPSAPISVASPAGPASSAAALNVSASNAENRNELNELLGYGPLHSADKGVMSRIHELIDSVDLTTKDKNGDTPLHIAMYIGDYEAAKYIIDKNSATLNIVNPKDGYTPLLYCIRNYGRHYTKYGIYYDPPHLLSPEEIINKILNMPDFNINQIIQNGEKQITALSLALQMREEYTRSVEPSEKAMAEPYDNLILLLQERGARQGGKLRKRTTKQYRRTRRQRN